MKVLIVSHNCFSSSQSMGKTLVSFFTKFDKTELMQLYFYPSIPNVDVCGDYYRITDKNMLSSIIHRRKCGRKIRQSEITSDNTLFADANEQKQYSRINRTNSMVRRARDVLWKIGAWKTKDLIQWLQKGKPDVVFYALGDATFSQKIAVWVADFLQIPLVTYVCDEYYLSGKSLPLCRRLLNDGMIRGIEKTVKKSKHLITICDDLGELYKRIFGSTYTTVMTGSSFGAGKIVREPDADQISFIGNLSLNRWRSLLDIADALDYANRMNGTQYKLYYYGAENGNMQGRAIYGGRLNAEQIKDTMEKSRMLIHTESFEPEYEERVKYSVSTKIADSLASGVPLLGYAPACVASMEHLIKNQCALIATDKTMLNEKLAEFLSDIKNEEDIINNAIRTAKCYHDTHKNSSIVREVLDKTIKLQLT